MKEKEPQALTFKQGGKYTILLCSWFFFIVAVSIASLPFFPDEITKKKIIAISIFSIAGFTFFISLFWYTFRLARRIPFSSISVDPDGMWLAHKNKNEGLVPWNAITDIKERGTLQRMDLIGINGEILFRIEYDISDFQNLRAYIVKNAKLGEYPHLPIRFSVNRLCHLVYPPIIFGLAFLGWYLGQQRPLIAYSGTGLGILFLGREYLSTVWHLTLDHHGCKVQYLFRTLNFQYRDIEKVNLVERYMKGKYHEVQISLKNRTKPINLKDLGAGSLRLYIIINRVLEKKSVDSHLAN